MTTRRLLAVVPREGATNEFVVVYQDRRGDKQQSIIEEDDEETLRKKKGQKRMPPLIFREACERIRKRQFLPLNQGQEQAESTSSENRSSGPGEYKIPSGPYDGLSYRGKLK